MIQLLRHHNWASADCYEAEGLMRNRIYDFTKGYQKNSGESKVKIWNIGFVKKKNKNNSI